MALLQKTQMLNRLTKSLPKHRKSKAKRTVKKNALSVKRLKSLRWCISQRKPLRKSKERMLSRSWQRSRLLQQLESRLHERPMRHS